MLKKELNALLKRDTRLMQHGRIEVNDRYTGYAGHHVEVSIVAPGFPSSRRIMRRVYRSLTKTYTTAEQIRERAKEFAKTYERWLKEARNAGQV